VDSHAACPPLKVHSVQYCTVDLLEGPWNPTFVIVISAPHIAVYQIAPAKSFDLLAFFVVVVTRERPLIDTLRAGIRKENIEPIDLC
jgi:hypothetical protein